MISRVALFRPKRADDREPLLLLAILAAAVVRSAISPTDWRDWVLELLPVFVGVTALVVTYRRFPLTSMSYRLALIVGLLLAIGGHFMFSRVPLGDWIEHALRLSRNPFDRIVHFSTGVAAAMIGREILRRKTRLSKHWVFILVAACCLAGAAIYEFLEWAAVEWNVDARHFVSTQGDRWDAHWDMLTTFTGALCSLALFSREQDRQLRELRTEAPPSPRRAAAR